MKTIENFSILNLCYKLHICVMCGHGLYVITVLILLFMVLLLEKIAEYDGGKYESAVYAAQCSNLKRLLPVCTDWEVCFALLTLKFF